MDDIMIIRVKSIIRDSADVVVDVMETTKAESVMGQTLRELDHVIDEIGRELDKTSADKYLLNQQLIEEQRQHQDLAEQASRAVTQNRDDLAEAAIAQQLEIEAYIPVLQSTLDEYEQREQELDSYINALQGRRWEITRELSF